MCKCDSFDSSIIAAGQPATFTAFGRVEGADVTKAKIESMTFKIIEGTTLIGVSQPIPASEVSRTASLVRYRSDWSFGMPNPIKKGVTYYVRADIKCVQASLSFLQDRAVLADKAEQQGLVGRILGFFGSLFGSDKDEAQVEQPNETPVYQWSPPVTPDIRYNLQLKTFMPAKSVNKACPAMTFRFDDPI
jgi:hypothetical protein